MELGSKKLLYDVDEVTQLLGMGRSKLYHYIQNGTMRSLLLGRRRKVPAEAVDDFVRRMVEETSTMQGDIDND